MTDEIVIFDFGSQYTQLIARRIREIGVYCSIIPYNKKFELRPEIKGVVLAGSPFSVKDENALHIDLNQFFNKIPVLGICYGAQYIANELGGVVDRSSSREYGRASMNILSKNCSFLQGIDKKSQVWMSHGDSIKELPVDFELLANTDKIRVAAFQSKANSKYEKPIIGIQFHPEVSHSTEGIHILKNFVVEICGCSPTWSSKALVEKIIEDIKTKVGDEQVLLGLSGGVDSTVAAVLLQKAIGDNLFCFFINNGLLRKNEYDDVLVGYKGMGLNVTGIDASQEFYEALGGISDPELKRKAIGRVFVEVFEKESKKLPNVKWLGQGTIYPDVIESVSVHGPSVTIKSHHNVGGLPKEMGLGVVEPLRMLFKDEVRRVGATLEISATLLGRHPFPGPGLGIRIIGDITPEKVRLLQDADYIYIKNLRERGLYDKVWQAGAILLPIRTVGVMGDERTYEKTVVLRCVNSIDGMTADWSHLPHEFLGKVSKEIINNVKGINRVVYDISTKPPATIEWE